MGIEKAVKLCDSYCRTHDSRMKWMWGEGLLGFALLELDGHLGEERYLGFLKDYCRYYAEHKPAVASSDTSAPGLITYTVWKKTGDPDCRMLTDLVLDYMEHEPRVLDGLVNHMGHSGYDTWYPKSVWVDSLMMFGVFAGFYGKEAGNDVFLDMARKQPVLLAKYLEDKKTGLWYHCYLVDKKTHYPRRRIFWGRGNSWIIAALPRILDSIGDCPERAEIMRILETVSSALKVRQKKDGSFTTLLGRFGSYKESSATALIAAGWLHAVRKGYLPESYREPALKAYAYADSCVRDRNGLVKMGKISGPTIPLPVLPFLGYALVPKGTDWSYGVAGYVWASMEYDRLKGSP